jgi:hypothetical protein
MIIRRIILPVAEALHLARSAPGAARGPRQGGCLVENDHFTGLMLARNQTLMF